MSTFTPTKEVNKIIRGVLKRAFPVVKFSVTKTPGSSITISWVDGPTAGEVEALTQFACGADFDGSQDACIRRSDVNPLEESNFIVAEELAKFLGGWGGDFHPLNRFVFMRRTFSNASLVAEADRVENEAGMGVVRDSEGLPAGNYDDLAHEFALASEINYADSWREVVVSRLGRRSLL